MIQKLKDNSALIAYWPVASFIIVLIGYLTFYFYTNYNDIPFSDPSLILIIGLGLFVSTFVALTFYLGYSAKQTPKLSWAISLSFFMYILSQDSTKVSSIIMIFLVAYYFLYLINPKSKINAQKINPFPILSELIITLAGVAFAVFYDSSFMLVFPGVFVLMIIVYFSKGSLQKLLVAAVISLLLASATFPTTLLKNVNYTFFGLTRMKAKIVMSDSTVKIGVIKFQDNNYLYMEDSLKQTLLIPKSHLSLIIKDKEAIKPNSLITDIKNMLKNYR
ncbi:MAG: hypothetical protein IPJ02_08430 [Chitinophagaceae bacterium]|nr:hypothetical protein [Chitinophagaceae bacterium]